MKKILLLFISLQVQAGFFSKAVDLASKIVRHSVPVIVTADILHVIKTVQDREASALEQIDTPSIGETIDLAKKDYKVVGDIIPKLIREEATKKLGADRASKLNVIIACERGSMAAHVDNKSRDYLFISPREFLTIDANNDQKKVNQARAVLQHEFTHLKENHCSNSILARSGFHAYMYLLSFYGLSLFARPAQRRLLTIGMRCVSPVLLGLSGALVTYPLYNTVMNCKAHEWQADEGIENDAAVLQGAIDYFKELQQEWNRLPLLTKIGLSIKDANCHPSNEARIARFEERLALLKQKSSESIV